MMGRNDKRPKQKSRRGALDLDFDDLYEPDDNRLTERNPKLRPITAVMVARFIAFLAVIALPVAMGGCIMGFAAWNREVPVLQPPPVWEPQFTAVADVAAKQFAESREGVVVDRVDTLRQAYLLGSKHIGPAPTTETNWDSRNDMHLDGSQWQRFVYSMQTTLGDTELLSFVVTEDGIGWPTYWPAGLGTGSASSDDVTEEQALLVHQDAVSPAVGGLPRLRDAYKSAKENFENSDDYQPGMVISAEAVARQSAPVNILLHDQMPTQCATVGIGSIGLSDDEFATVESYLAAYVQRQESELITMAGFGAPGKWPLYPRTGYSYVDQSLQALCVLSLSETDKLVQAWFLTETDGTSGADSMMIEMRDLILRNADGLNVSMGATPYMEGGVGQ